MTGIAMISSPTRRLRHDPTRTFSTCAHGKNPIDHYQWRYATGRNGLPMEATIWMEHNLIRAWAWWFDEKGQCCIGFEDQHEMMMFVLSSQLG